MKHFYPPAPLLAGHPYFPARLGYMRLLGLLRPDIARVLRTAEPFTLMGVRNLTTLYREGQRILRLGVEGDFIEIGVHRGGSAAVLASQILEWTNRHLHLFDRWGDLPEPTVRDGNRYDEYRKDRIGDKLADLRDNPPLGAAKHLIEETIGFPAERLHYYPGWYSETLPEYSGQSIAFASLDCDYYESMKLALEFVDRHAARSATIVADDYGTWPGAKAAVDEWLATTRRKLRFHPLRTGPAVLRLQG